MFNQELDNLTDESGGHLESSGRDVADGSLNVVRDPLDEVAAVLVLDVQHLLIHLDRDRTHLTYD